LKEIDKVQSISTPATEIDKEQSISAPATETHKRKALKVLEGVSSRDKRKKSRPGV
jgi:hypothetical protein